MSNLVEFSPVNWPECGACGIPYVLRRAFTFQIPTSAQQPRGALQWVWQRDCVKPNSKACKNAKPIIAGVNAA